MIATILAFFKTMYQIFTTNIITIIIAIMAIISFIIEITKKKQRN